MGAPNTLVPLVLALYVPATLLAFRALGPRRGLLAAMLGGWLLLPCFDHRYDLPIVDTKLAFVGVTLLVASLVTDLPRWLALRPRPADLGAALLAAGPFATALANGLGPGEGLSASVETFVAFGVPYLLGRVHLGSPRGQLDLARWLVGAALLYAPLCLWEIRMSPQLHRLLYGYHPFDYFGFAVRFGGYRPNVFMAFGLMLGTFLATATLVAWWLWRSRAVASVAGLPIGWATAALVVTTALAKSTAASLLLVLGVAVLEATRTRHGRAALLAVALAGPAFCAARIAGWEGAEVVEAAGLFGPDRAQSVAFRAGHEQRLLDRALDQPWLGWGRWGRSRIRDDEGADVSVTDSLWIITLGTKGLLGLIALGLMLLLPLALLLRRFPPRRWRQPRLAPAAALALGTALWALDGLLNAMVSPIFPAMAGAAITFSAGRWAPRRVAVAARAARAAQAAPAAPAGPAGGAVGQGGPAARPAG